MSKWMTLIVDTQGAGPIRTHPPVEDLARLADGHMPEPDRRACVRHLDKCSQCFDLFDAILTHVRTPPDLRAGRLHEKSAFPIDAFGTSRSLT